MLLHITYSERQCYSCYNRHWCWLRPMYFCKTDLEREQSVIRRLCLPGAHSKLVGGWQSGGKYAHSWCALACQQRWNLVLIVHCSALPWCGNILWTAARGLRWLLPPVSSSAAVIYILNDLCLTYFGLKVKVTRSPGKCQSWHRPWSPR